jgi:hypothetical protein
MGVSPMRYKWLGRLAEALVFSFSCGMNVSLMRTYLFNFSAHGRDAHATKTKRLPF